MDYSQHLDNVLVFDPFKIRPGTPCVVTLIYSVKEDFVWDNETDFIYDFPGFVSIDAVKSDEVIPYENVEIEEIEGVYRVHIVAFYDGPRNLSIYYYKTIEQSLVSRSAFSSLDNTYYKDYVTKDDVIIPKTIVELEDVPEASGIFNKVDITFEMENNGICYIDGSPITMSNMGMVEYGDEELYILKKGKEYVNIPLDSDIKEVRIEGNYKVVEIDNQEWKEGYNEARGIILYSDRFLVLTNKSLCVFNIYDNFDTPIFEDINIQGYDLTYLPDDSILVSNGEKLYKYRIRHNNVYIDRENKRIFFREADPNVAISNL